MDQIIKSLTSLGLTESECKAYLALLQQGPQNGYELSKNSGIPRSKIYGLLESLVTKNFVLGTKTTDPKHYKAISPDKLISEKKNEFLNSMEYLENELTSITKGSSLEHLWQILGRDRVFASCTEVIADTQEELYIQVWEEDLPAVLDTIRALEAQNKQTIVILYTNEQNNHGLKNVFFHGYLEGKLEDMGARWITVVSDSKEVVFGYLKDGQSEAIRTENDSFVFLSKEYVKHDAYCLELIRASQGIENKVMDDTVKNIRNLLKIGSYS